MTEDSGFAFDNILAKVQGLLAVADDPATTPEAAENYRNKAEAMMFKYRIEEAMLGSTGKEDKYRQKPVWRTFRVCKAGNTWRKQYQQIAVSALAHVDAKAVVDTEVDNETGDYWYVLHALGYDSDLRFAELIFTAGMLAFGTKLEPKYDPNLSDQVNAYVLRSAGWEGHRIAKAIWGDDAKPLRVKARSLFRKEAEARGESVEGLTGRGVNVAQFREDYAEGFADEFWSRLWRMRQEHAQDERGLVLASRKQDVEEALYERYPHMRPKPVDPNAVPVWEDPQEKCAKCKAAKSGYCREHQYLKPSTARPRYASYSAAGAMRGRAAARTVDLGATHTPRAGSADRPALS